MNCPHYVGLVGDTTREQLPCSSSFGSAVLNIRHLLVPFVPADSGVGLAGHNQGAGMEPTTK
jgi:hypothetical protein